MASIPKIVADFIVLLCSFGQIAIKEAYNFIRVKVVIKILVFLEIHYLPVLSKVVVCLHLIYYSKEDVQTQLKGRHRY